MVRASGLSQNWCLGVAAASTFVARTHNAGAVWTASRRRTQPRTTRAGETRHPFLRRTARNTFIASILLLSACSGNGAATTSGAISSGPVTVSNQGGTLEGHTPTAFAGMGTGLFAGDNLNQSFPEGVGVQLYLTFTLPSDLLVGEAQVVSDVLHTSGTPFEDLGPLVIEPIMYQNFGPDLFDLEAIGAHTECTVLGNTSIECDVTAALQDFVERGNTTAQFRIRFTHPADNDGNQDLAMFFRTDSNTNEQGIFELTITPDD